MQFSKLPNVETAEFYIDIALNRATRAAKDMRTSVSGGNRFQKSKTLELHKIKTAKNSIVDSLNHITKHFPSVDGVSEFYYELMEITIGAKKLKKALGAVNWAVSASIKIGNLYLSKIKKCQEMSEINKIRNQYYGRAASVLKQIKKELLYLENARKTMKSFPTIKEKYFTVAIAGFPNVGKTTLLYKLTGSKPAISNYAFTTKGVNVSYFIKNKENIQVLDTPGTLNRFNKMNYIEKQAHLAIKYCAELIVYVFDPTEPYLLKDQEDLFKKLTDLDKDVIVYLSKTDIHEDISKFSDIEFVSDIKELKKLIGQYQEAA